jgi:nitrate/nitrite-specific signal transduction histidine kinase
METSTVDASACFSMLLSALRPWRAELEVSIDPTTAGLRVSIQDNGIGFEVIPETGAFDQLDRYVILGKQERARLNGGDLQLGSNLGIGTTVTRGLAWASQAKAGY